MSENELESQADAAAKSCTTITLVLLGFCVFAVLTCGTFTDAALISKAGVTASIPAIGLGLPVLEFLFATPLLLLALHAYFLVHLNGYLALGRELNSHEGFNDRDRSFKTHVSIFTSLIPQNSRTARTEWSVSKLAPFLARSFAFVMVPFSIWMIWFRALALHNYIVDAFVLTPLIVSIVFSVCEFTQEQPGDRLRPTARLDRSLLTRWVLADRPFWIALLLMQILYFALIEPNSVGLVATVIELAIFCFRTWRRWRRTPLSFSLRHNLLEIAACFFLFGLAITIQAHHGELNEESAGIDKPKRAFIYFQTVRIGFMELSKKPPNWTPRTDPQVVVGAIIRRQNLRDMYAFQVFAANSRFDMSDLSGANLQQSDLRDAILNDAILKNANLAECSCEGANFHRAKMSGARLTKADFSHANLSDSDVTFEQLEQTDTIDEKTYVDPPLNIESCAEGNRIRVTLSSKETKGKTRWIDEPEDDGVTGHWGNRIKKLLACPKQ